MKSAARLLAVGGGGDGTYRAGIEIRLDPNTITYWRMPGEAGAPPVFSYSGSDNVAEARMLFPAPRKFDEGGAAAFGYDHDVIFPLRVTARDATRPVTLHVNLVYAACEKICIPVRAEAQLPLPQTPPSGPFEDALAAFEAQVPVKQALGADAALTITGVHALEGDLAAGNGHFSVVGRLAGKPGRLDLFAEGPEGWYLEAGPVQAAPDGTFVAPVTIAAMPKGSDVAATLFTFTLVAGDQAIEVETRLDAKTATP
ncbi:MAG: hypothetical protein JO273_04550 [Methylobacteriaceae bacterium]|nr:hypothetical protein [Methylobacteriaceae bacterium]